jgi:hypothetical protein
MPMSLRAFKCWGLGPGAPPSSDPPDPMAIFLNRNSENIRYRSNDRSVRGTCKCVLDPVLQGFRTEWKISVVRILIRIGTHASATICGK